MYNLEKDNRLDSLNKFKQKRQDEISQMFKEISVENEVYNLITL